MNKEKIEITDIWENEDGSLSIVMSLSPEIRDFLLSVGLNTVIEKQLKSIENDNVN